MENTKQRTGQDLVGVLDAPRWASLQPTTTRALMLLPLKHMPLAQMAGAHWTRLFHRHNPGRAAPWVVCGVVVAASGCLNASYLESAAPRPLSLALQLFGGCLRGSAERAAGWYHLERVLVVC